MQSESFLQEPDKLVCFAKIAEQAERYNDQIDYMIKYFEKCEEVKYFEELNLYSNGYKCKVNSVRTAWRAVSNLQQKETNSKSRSSAIIQFYKENLEKQIRQICQEVIFITHSLTDKISDLKARFLCFKIKGDYHRYLCEIAKDQELKRLQKECQSSYLKGLNAINESPIKEPMKTDALKLGISLNLSVFYYEILNQPSKAIEVSQKAFQECLQAISDIEDSRYTDVVTIMQLLSDNLNQWRQSS